MKNPEDFTKAVITKNQIQPTCKTQNQQAKIGHILYTSNEQSENEMNNSIYNSITKNKILRNKLNQVSERLVH